MKSILSFCLLLGLLLISGVTYAEGNCPEGYYPIGGESGQPGPQGCAPIPGYEQQRQQQAPRGPTPQWDSRWGAVATDSIKGILGVSTNAESRNEAERKALTECQTKGGTQCKLQNSYSNACVAMITGNKIFNIGSDSDLNRAVQSGMKKCTAADTNCHVYYSACSLPARIK